MALTNYQPGPLENMMGTIIGARFVPTPIPIKGTDYTNKIIVSPLDLKMFHRDCESRLHCTREASYLDRTHPGGVELKCAVNDQTRKKSFASEQAKPRILLLFRIPFPFHDAKKIFFSSLYAVHKL